MHVVSVTDIDAKHGQHPVTFAVLPRIGETVVLSERCFEVLAVEHCPSAAYAGETTPAKISMLVKQVH